MSPSMPSAFLMEYPKFEGKNAQCFFTFQKKMNRALISNQVPRFVLVNKLRASLSGYALTLAPEA